MIFVDTGAWYAGVVERDENHPRAKAWLEQNNQRLCTSDYIVDETLTLLRARGHLQTAIDLGSMLVTARAAALFHVDVADVREAWNIFRNFQDKQWSFTDCTSMAVMRRLKIRQAFSFDQHFRQFGTVEVVP